MPNLNLLLIPLAIIFAAGYGFEHGYLSADQPRGKNT
jgi:hypothetical protein